MPTPADPNHRLPVFEIRRDNLEVLLRTRDRGAKQKLAEDLGVTPTQISHWLRDPRITGSRKISETQARAIENALGLEPGLLDVPNGAADLLGVHPTLPHFAPGRLSPAARERPTLPYMQRQAHPTPDPTLLAATTRAVLIEVQAVKGKPMIEKVANIVQLAYEHNSGFGGLDEAYIHSLVKLMQ